MILAEMGFKRLRDVIGRVDLLEPKPLDLPKTANFKPGRTPSRR